MAYLQRSSANNAPTRGRPRHSRGTNGRSRTSPDSSPSTQISSTATDASSTTVDGSRNPADSFNQHNGDYTSGSSASSNNSAISSASSNNSAISSARPPAPTLPVRLQAMNPPQAVLDAMAAAVEARDRLTLQVYYCRPSYFDKYQTGDPEYACRVRALRTVQLPDIAGLLVAVSAWPTIRAALVLLGDESSAMEIPKSWLVSTTADQPANIELRGILRDVEITLRHNHEASSMLYKAMAPQYNGKQT